VKRQTVTDFLWGIAFGLAIVVGLGVLSFWLHWDDAVDYRIERQRPEPKFIKV
jgi:hypothetical protein